MAYSIKSVFWISALALVVCCVISIIADECNNSPGFAYKIHTYAERLHQSCDCNLLQGMVQGDAKCGRLCNSYTHTCIFFFLDGNDCIICSRITGSLGASDYILTEGTMIYEKQDAKCTVVTFGPYGGHGGNPFDDVSVADAGEITAIHFGFEGPGHCFGFTYGSTYTCHGAGSAIVTTVTLEEGEHITAVTGPTSGLTYGLQFTTNRRTIGPYGTLGTQHIGGVENCVLGYISGKVGNLIDSLTYHFYC